MARECFTTPAWFAGVVLALLAAGGCSDTAPPRTAGFAIVAGTPTTTEPAVVALAARRLSCGQPLLNTCSGVLIGARVVLTAAHCLDKVDTDQLLVVFGDNVADQKTRHVIGVLDALVHPDFVLSTNTHDIALLLLADDPPATPLAINRAPLDQALAGELARMVGFGPAAPGSADPGGIKLSGTATISQVDALSFSVTPAPSMSCTGDSGGPVFVAIDGKEVVAGITTWGDLQCATFAVNLRTDAYAGFIDGALAGWKERMVPSGPIEPEVNYCEISCQDDADCPGGMHCQPGDSGKRCALIGRTVGKLGDACTTGCVCGFCVPVTIAGVDQCRCLTSCGADAQCLGPPIGPPSGKDVEAPDSTAEVTPPIVPSGCSAGAIYLPRPVSWATLAMILVLFIGWRRRSSHSL